MALTTIGHVFMSYSRTDEEVMRRITTFLRNQGIKVWVDNENLVPGTPIWEEEIERAIDGAFAVVVVLSPDAKGSEWVRREITYADQYEKRVFPVLVTSDEDSSIPIRLITRQFVDIRSNEEVGLNSLSAAVAFYAEGIEVRERKAREEAEKLARVQAEREAAERESARLKAELEAADLALREAAEKTAKKIAEEIAVREKAAREKAAREKTEREKAEREVIRKSAHEAKAKGTRTRREKRRQKYLELLNKTIHAIKLYPRRFLLIAIVVMLVLLTGIFAPTLLLSTSTSIPPSTSTRRPTPVPTPTITPLPIAMNSYDDFNSGDLDSKRWALGQDPGLTTIQQDGVLKLAADTGICGVSGCGGGLSVVGGTSTATVVRPLSVNNAIEARMLLANEFRGSNFGVLLKVAADLPYHWAYYCAMEETSTELFFECNSDISPTHTSKRIPIARNEYYTMRIEVDPSNATFRAYLNNRLVDIFEPSAPGQLKKLDFIFSVLLGVGSNTSGSALVDWVKLGKPASP